MEKNKVMFSAKGHRNISGKHRNTLEFTKDKDISVKGDCIIGVDADFNPAPLRKLAKNYHGLRMELSVGKDADVVFFESNPGFKCKDELVLRLGDFVSDRTLGVHASKSSMMLDRKMMDKMKTAKGRMRVSISPRYKVLIFDLDDTLEKFTEPKFKAYDVMGKVMYKKYGVYPPTFVKVLEEVDEEFVKGAVDKGPDAFDRRLWFPVMFERLGVSVSRREMLELVNLYWDTINKHIRLLPGAAEMLRELRKRFKIVVMSDADGPKQLKMTRVRKMGLDRLADMIIIGNDVGVNKPDMRFYDKIFKKFGVNGDGCVMVGDKPWADLTLAKQLGMKTIRMKIGKWGERKDDDKSIIDHEVHDIKSLSDILSDL